MCPEIRMGVFHRRSVVESGCGPEDGILQYVLEPPDRFWTLYPDTIRQNSYELLT